MSTLGDTLEGLVAKLREQAHEAESPYGTKTPEEPDWDYVAKAFREIADELAAALVAEGRQRVLDAIVKGNVETLLAMQAAAPSLHKEPLPDAVAWLIERGGLCLGFCNRKFSWLTFTNESALRFSRRSDAIRFIEAMRGDMNLDDVLVTEHRWGL